MPRSPLDRVPTAAPDPRPTHPAGHRAAPHRPLVQFGAALASGTLLGLWRPLREGFGAPLMLTGAVALALGLSVAWHCLQRARGNNHRALWLPCVLALGLLRALAAPLPPEPGGFEDSPHSAKVASRFQSARTLCANPIEEPGLRFGSNRLGAWRALGGSKANAGTLESGNASRPWVEYESQAGAPRAGEIVLMLAGAALTPTAIGLPTPEQMGTATSHAKSDQGAVRPLQSNPKPDQIVRLSSQSGAGPTWRRSIDRWRADLALRLGRIRNGQLRALCLALVLGQTGALDYEQRQLFTRTGTRHLLAVSGLHVALFAYACLLPLGWIIKRGSLFVVGSSGSGPARAVASCLQIGGLLVFCAVAGSAAPVVRAAIALALILLAPHLSRPASRAGLPTSLRLRGRRADSLSLWFLALALELSVDPFAIQSLSVQLSYLAVLGILLGASRARPKHSAAPWSGPLKAALGSLLERWNWRLRMCVRTSVCAVIATLPIAWGTFGEVAPIGILATPLLLPSVSILLLGGWLELLGLDSVEAPLEFASRSTLTFLSGLDALPWTPYALPARPSSLVALACALALAHMYRPRRWKLRATAALFGLLLLPWQAGASNLEVIAMDVGHGSAVLVRTPGDAVLFDAGSRDRPHVWSAALGPLMARMEIRAPVVVLSHADRDHASALTAAIERRPPRQWMGELPSELEERLASNCERLDLEAGRLSWSSGLDPGLELHLLRGLNKHGNEGSRSLDLRYRGTRVLLCGDAEGEGLAAQLEGDVLQSPRETGRPTSLLLLPHHGSESPWFGHLMQRLEPEEIWVSNDRRPQLAAELDRRRIPWFSTGLHGLLSWRAGHAD